MISQKVVQCADIRNNILMVLRDIITNPERISPGFVFPSLWPFLRHFYLEKSEDGLLDFSADEIFEMASRREDGARFYRRAASAVKRRKRNRFQKLRRWRKTTRRIRQMREGLTCDRADEADLDPENQTFLPTGLGGPRGLRHARDPAERLKGREAPGRHPRMASAWKRTPSSFMLG